MSQECWPKFGKFDPIGNSINLEETRKLWPQQFDGCNTVEGSVKDALGLCDDEQWPHTTEQIE